MNGELIDFHDKQQELELTERESRIDRAQRNAYYEIGLELKAIGTRGCTRSIVRLRHQVADSALPLLRSMWLSGGIWRSLVAIK